MDAPTRDVATEQARALGDPTRHGIFRYIDEAPKPVGVAELTEHFGLNHNAIRQHLSKLRDADLVIEESSPPSGPGRPALRYRPNPGAAGRWESTTPYQQLATLLLDMVRSGDDPETVGRRAGQRLAKASRQADRVDLLEEVTRRLGFEPRRVARGDGVDLVLDRCPFADTAQAAPEVVCELHRGLAAGLVEASGNDAQVLDVQVLDVKVTDLVIKPPRRAGCRVIIR